jgi:hypothetical protein
MDNPGKLAHKTKNKNTAQYVLYTRENRRDNELLDNPETLATLGTQDTRRRLTKHKYTTQPKTIKR